MRLRRGSARLCCVLLLAGSALSVAPAQPAGATAACASGLVALTFDDGPKATMTPKFLTVLRDRKVPATFFVIGEQVRANPRLTRRMSALGFTIGNQTFHHENLLRLGDDAIKRTLRRTQRAISAVGAKPSNLMRPPFGNIDERVRAVVREVGLVPVLWTADPRDWDGRSASAIVTSTLAQLRPHQPNVVLLHDGVVNSANTLRALPRIIRGVRARGYCFARLDAGGAPAPVVPAARVSDASVDEAPGGSVLTVTVSLDRPTARATSARVRTVEGTASAGKDYVGLDQRLRFPAGTTRRSVRIRVRDDLRDERTERLTVLLSGARGLRIQDREGLASIRDDDPPPRVRVRDASVAEPASGHVEVPVTLRLGRPSERIVRLTVRTRAGSADSSDFVPSSQELTFAPGTVAARFTVTVLADAVVEGEETFEVRVVRGSNADISGATGVVTILPPTG